MCTVTFIAKGKTGFILTSNRDEIVERNTLPPKIYLEQGIKMLYPKDEVAGGTWIGVSENKRLVCLLNGAFTPHERKKAYKMSRGLIVKKLLAAKNAVQWIDDFDFTGIEPFTIILAEWNKNLKLYEFVWDATQKHFKILGNNPQIWSSSPLYTQTMKKMRKKWFSDFLASQTQSPSDIFKFHKNTGIGNNDVDLQIDRGFLKTVSITQVTVKGSQISMYYKDLIKGIKKSTSIPEISSDQK